MEARYKEQLECTVQSVSEALKSYLASCKANGLANGTIENYERIVGLYIRFMEQNGRGAVTVGSVNDWKVSLSENGVKITTLSNYMTVLRQFFEWAVKMEMLPKSPVIPAVMPSRKAVNVEQKKPYEHLLTAEEFQRILNSSRPKHVPKDRWLRNRAVLLVLLTSGVRNSELRDLTVNDLDFENGTITVRSGKGGKYRICSFPQIAQSAVRDYLDCGYRPSTEGNDDVLFGVNDENGFRKFERNALSQMVEKDIEKITGHKGCKTHSLRHFSASYLLSSGVNMDAISNLLGHSSCETTAMYAERLNPKTPSQDANNVFNSIAYAQEE